MGLTNKVIALTTVTFTALGGLVYGITDGHGSPLPWRKLIAPATLTCAFYLGLNNHPKVKLDVKVASVCTGIIATWGVICYSIGYTVGKLS